MIAIKLFLTKKNKKTNQKICSNKKKTFCAFFPSLFSTFFVDNYDNTCCGIYFNTTRLITVRENERDKKF